MSKLKEIAVQKIREADVINDDIALLRKREQSIRLDISNIKKAIENENVHLVGRKAVCSTQTDPSFQDKECTCIGVKCTDSFDIAPMFAYRGTRKSDIDFFEWL